MDTCILKKVDIQPVHRPRLVRAAVALACLLLSHQMYRN
jgi:hypothetical protein